MELLGSPLLLFASLLLAPGQDAGATATAKAATTTRWYSLEVEGLPALDYLLEAPLEAAETPGAIPLLLVLPPGGQDRRMAERALELYFDELPARAGWAVLVPALPEGLEQRAELELPGDFTPWMSALVARASEQLGAEPAAVHLAGISSGGRSAFALAGSMPGRFDSLTGLPGYLDPGAGAAELLAVSSLPVTLLAGEGDSRWLEGSRSTVERLRERGSTEATLEVLPGQGHVLEETLAPRIFAAIEAQETARRTRARHAASCGEVLDILHRAASTADEDVYFDLFTADAIFTGTDATERWSLAEFRAFALPYFERDTAWTYLPYERSVVVAPDLGTAWFDEKLRNEKYGDTRGSGVLRRVGERWRIAHYVLSFAVPNGKSAEVVRVIRD